MVRVEGLLTNGVENPAAVDPGQPQFSWQIIDRGERGIRQCAYRILVRSERDGREIWDSKRADSDVSAGVLYDGPALSSDTLYSWTVKVWTNSGGESAFSDRAFFRVGLSKEDWTADYLWRSEKREENSYACFRKDFEVGEGKIKEAAVYFSAHNDCQLFLDGVLIGVGPARSDPYSYGQYCACDIKQQMSAGHHVFAALVHWHGVWSDSGTNAEPFFLLEARLHYEDGTASTIKTDGTWKCNSRTPYIEEDPVYFGVYGGARNRASLRYDARREMEGWNQNAYDAASWENAVAVRHLEFKLYAQLVSRQSENEFLRPVSIRRDEDRWLVEFDRCLTGWPRIFLHENEPGDEIRLQYWEVERNFGDAGYDTYIAKGGEEAIYMPYVRHTSFRILEISGLKGKLVREDVQGIAAYSYADKQGQFFCSDQRLNHIYLMCERSGRQNCQQGIISVDANREQSPWTADSWNIGVGYLYNHKNTMVIDKVIKDYAGEQRENGNFLTCSPAHDYESEMIEWSLYWPMLLWEQYLFSGNKKLLADCYQSLERFLVYVAQFRDEDTGLYSPDGWRVSDYAGGSIENGGDNVVTNCHIYRAFQIAEEISLVLDREDNAQRYKACAEAVKAAINKNLLVDGEKYRTTTSGSQFHPLGTAWALRFGIVPSEARHRVWGWMEKQRTPMDIGGYGGDALYNGLYCSGLGRTALLDFARYDQMWEKNRTNWESFGELSVDNMGNHAWTAYPAYILQKYVGGISPTSGGFASFDVKPVTEGLEFAQAVVPTVKGNIAVSWRADQEKGFTLSVTVPVNTVARVYIPADGTKNWIVKEQDTVVYSDKGQAQTVPGVSGGTREEDFISFTVGSGTYCFETTA